ncbi:MAG: septum formation initiator family protein [Actinomycetes bacterium]
MSAPTTDARPRAEVRPPAPSSRASLTSRAVILALVLATLVIALSMPARAWFSQRSQIASLKANVESAQQRVADLQVQQQRWSDPSFVAAEARRRLHFVLPGEVGYVTLGSAAAAAGAAADTGAGQGAWYSSLWGALQEADDHAATPSP